VTIARESQQVSVAVIVTLHTDKAVLQVAEIEIATNHLLDIRPPESVRT
jgi:hypothetical protein